MPPSDTLDEMAKDGRLTQYTLKAERDRRTGGGHAADPLPRTLIILVILGVAGSGKTRGWAQATAHHYARRPGVLVPGHALHIVFACPTIVLMEQTYAMLAAAGRLRLWSTWCTAGIPRAGSVRHWTGCIRRSPPVRTRW